MPQQCPISASTSIYFVRTFICLCDEKQLFEERLDPISDSDVDVCFEPPLLWSWECWRNWNKIPRSLAWSFEGSTWRKRQVLLSSLWLRPSGSPAWTADTNTHQGEVEIAHASTNASGLSSRDLFLLRWRMLSQKVMWFFLTLLCYTQCVKLSIVYAAAVCYSNCSSCDEMSLWVITGSTS